MSCSCQGPITDTATGHFPTLTLNFGISLPSLTAHVQVLVPALVCSS
jgi:hypothetical protein